MKDVARVPPSQRLHLHPRRGLFELPMPPHSVIGPPCILNNDMSEASLEIKWG